MADVKLVGLSGAIATEYAPVLNQVPAPFGIKLLALAHAIMEGYYQGTKAYKNNNPGNIKNNGGAFVNYSSLYNGIVAQISYLQRIIGGQHRAYPKGGNTTLSQYINIYAPAADNNVPNNYINRIISSFAAQGYGINRNTTLNQIAGLGGDFTSQDVKKKSSNKGVAGIASNVYDHLHFFILGY